jgi:hypothetical protein
MRRLTTAVRDVDWPGRTRRLAGWLNPVVAPLETIAALDALGPSLMPRTSRLAGSSIHRYACCRSQRMATAPQIGGR